MQIAGNVMKERMRVVAGLFYSEVLGRVPSSVRVSECRISQGMSSLPKSETRGMGK